MDKVFSSNNTVKVLALVLAVVLWLYVAQGDQTQIVNEVTKPFYHVALVPQNVSPGLRVTSIPAEVDTISLKGTPGAVDSVTPKELVAMANLSGLGEGTHEVKVDVQLPQGVKLAGVTPVRVQVALDAIVARQMGVRVDLLGLPGNNLAAHNPSVRPSQVFVDGPRSVVDQVVAVVAKASVSGATASITESLPLRAVDKDGKEISGISISPAVVDVVVPVGLPIKEVPIKPVISGQPASGYTMTTVQVEPLTIKVSGPQARLDEIEFIATETIDISKLEADITKDLRLQVPAQVTIPAPNPEKAKVTVRIAKATTPKPDVPEEPTGGTPATPGSGKPTGSITP